MAVLKSRRSPSAPLILVSLAISVGSSAVPRASARHAVNLQRSMPWPEQKEGTSTPFPPRSPTACAPPLLSPFCLRTLYPRWSRRQSEEAGAARRHDRDAGDDRGAAPDLP